MCNSEMKKEDDVMTLQLNDEIFPANLMYLRKKYGLSQLALARRTGISVYWIRGVEKGRFYSQISNAEYERLSSALCVSPLILGCYDLRGGKALPPGMESDNQR